MEGDVKKFHSTLIFYRRVIFYQVPGSSKSRWLLTGPMILAKIELPINQSRVDYYKVSSIETFFPCSTTPA
jgi:hypothetical protein